MFNNYVKSYKNCIVYELTQHWLEDYGNALKEYNLALEKFEKGIYQRNILNDVRLSFELLVKSLLNNEKSLENQVADLG